MPRYWTTLPTGHIAIGRLMSETFTVPLAPNDERLRRVLRWGALAQQVAKPRGVPVAWVLGLIWRESGGDALSRDDDQRVGLLKIPPERWGEHSPSALLQPRCNLEVGVAWIAEALRYSEQWPPIVSLYRSGGELTEHGLWQPFPSNESPWGMLEPAGYIDQVVAATNSFFSALEFDGAPDRTMPPLRVDASQIPNDEVFGPEPITRRDTPLPPEAPPTKPPR